MARGKQNSGADATATNEQSDVQVKDEEQVIAPPVDAESADAQETEAAVQDEPNLVPIPDGVVKTVAAAQIATDMATLANYADALPAGTDIQRMAILAHKGEILIAGDDKLYICEENYDNLLAAMAVIPSLKIKFLKVVEERISAGRESDEYKALLDEFKDLRGKVSHLREQMAELTVQYAAPFKADDFVETSAVESIWVKQIAQPTQTSSRRGSRSRSDVKWDIVGGDGYQYGTEMRTYNGVQQYIRFVQPKMGEWKVVGSVMGDLFYTDPDTGATVQFTDERKSPSKLLRLYHWAENAFEGDEPSISAPKAMDAEETEKAYHASNA